MANVTKPSTVLRCFAAYSDSKGCQEYLYDLCKSNDRLTTYLFLNKELDESIYLEMLPAADTSLVVRSLAKPLTDRMVKEVARQSALLSRQTLFEVSAHGGYLSESSFRYLLEQSWLTEDLLEFVIKSCELPDQLRLLAKERFARFPNCLLYTSPSPRDS